MPHNRTTSRRWAGAALAATAAVAVVLAPAAASATPSTPEEAAALVAEAGQELTQLDEQVHQAQLTVAEMQSEAARAEEAAADAQAALDEFDPVLRSIAQSGYTGGTTSRVAAFLTSESADELVQQITTLDLIAEYTDGLLAGVSAAQEEALGARADADAAAAEAEAALATLEDQQAEVEARVAEYEADFARLSAAEQAVVTNTLAGPVLAAPSIETATAAAPSEAAAAVVAAALAQVGDPYVWGASGPNGFDCSGLTQYAYAAADVALPHSSRSQSQMGVEVSRAQLQPGDIVYFYSPVSHVGLYIGDGRMVHARTFGQPVAVTSVDMDGYAGARRIL